MSYENNHRRQDCPTGEQLRVLEHITQRVEREMTEERSGMVASTACEPIFDLIHGIPGAGKSKVIAWICELFTDVLGWESGTQFICLAVQNTMAANIGGRTIHHWANIPFRDEKGNTKGGGGGGKRDTRMLYHRCLSMRWILIDEISMVSAELLSELQHLVQQAVRTPGTYKLRPDKSKRVFGGINTLLFGDWWQLRPVRATALFDHPSKAKNDLAYEGLLLLWGQNKDSVQRVWELTEQKRCPDEFYTAFLTECRNGALQRENYLFIHGQPTLNVGSMIPDAAAPVCNKAPVCNNDDCKNLPERWKEVFKKGVAITKDLQTEGHPGDEENLDPAKRFEKIKGECKVCQKERLARSVVAYKKNGQDDERFKKKPFFAAPYIHQLNNPKHAANVTRSRRWADEHRHSVNWVTAHDYPLHRDDQAMFLFDHQRNMSHNRMRDCAGPAKGLPYISIYICMYVCVKSIHTCM